MEKRIETFVWEFSFPVTISVLSHSEIKYSDAKKALRSIPKEDIYKAFLKALEGNKVDSGFPVWYGGEHLEEGIYLRELTYDEKYRGKQTPEIPIPVVWDGDKDKK